MDLMLLRIFQGQVRDQCRFAQLAHDELMRQLASSEPNMDQIWYSLQNLLNAVANLSKAFWGQKGKLSQKREPLRQSLGVTEPSALQSPDMRNNFEHFDDRLEKWVE